MIFDPILDLFRGKAVTIPPLDGAFRPNQALDDAPLIATLPDVDNALVHDGRLVVSSGRKLLSISSTGQQEVLQEFDAEICATAASASGTLAIALVSGSLVLDREALPLPKEIRCITALAFAPDGALWLANGADRIAPDQWARDLMSKGRSGSVWKIEPGSRAPRKVAGGLAFPYGLLANSDGVAVSEAWHHRIVRISASGPIETVVDNLPGYPARLSQTADGGAWLSIFAPRNRLIEFVLQEQRYREDMMASVPPEFWIAPSLSSGTSFLEPLQCGGIKTMGIHKPWSPSRSYGLVVKLDARLQPLSSLHSRADGIRHGTTSVAEHEGRLFITCKGAGMLVSMDVAEVR
ncbi:hypothetical protein AB4Z25_14365 [Rhizobium sp. RAF36]|uniref:hypothetical protein n=1 Tax=Rhizobium sp. RAF36 TaxID=3233055 RepID=UPI003F97D8B7